MEANMVNSESRSFTADNRHSEQPTSVADLALLSLQSWSQAVVFLQPEDLEVLWMNDAATIALRTCGATVAGGRIQFPDKARHAAFARFLSGAKIEVGSWILDLTDGKGARVFRCRVVPETGHRLLSIFNPEIPSTYLPDVGAILGLTPSEARIIQGLVDGRRADQLAQDLAISLETVRTHIRRIYSKTGVNSREQLIAKVSVYRVP